MKSFDNKFEGKYLGNLGQFIGQFSKIKIDEIDCWWNQSRNITLIINDGEKTINCSQKLSDIIREFNLDDNTDELKKYSVYEFADGGKYVTHLIENKAISNNPVFDLKKENFEYNIKELTKNNELYITEQNRKGRTLYLTISESRVHEVINEIIKQVSKSEKKIEFSKEELLSAFKSLPRNHNTSSELRSNYYLGKQASIFNNLSEARFSIFGNGKRLALVKVICDMRYLESLNIPNLEINKKNNTKANEIKKKKDFIIAKKKKKDKTIYLSLSDDKLNRLIDELIEDIEKFGEKSQFSKEELLKAIKSLPSEENTSVYIKRGYYIGKQAFLFRNIAEIRFSIFGVKRLALVGIVANIRTRIIRKNKTK
jgi:hypothetical protein